MTPEEGGVPGGDAEAHVDEEVKVPSPASVPGETKDVGTDRKRENSPEIERGDFKRLCAALETQRLMPRMLVSTLITRMSLVWAWCALELTCVYRLIFSPEDLNLTNFHAISTFEAFLRDGPRQCIN